MAGASVGKASGRFSSLNSGFCFHRIRLDGRTGALNAPVTAGLGSADAWKQGLGLDFQGHVPGRTAVPAVPPGILPGAGALEIHCIGPNIFARVSCQGTGTGWDTRRDRRDACSPLLPIGTL